MPSANTGRPIAVRATPSATTAPARYSGSWTSRRAENSPTHSSVARRNVRMRNGSARHALSSPSSLVTMTPISGQRTATEISSADAYAAFISSPGKKKFSALPLRDAMNAARATPKSPDSAWRGDSRRTSRAIVSRSARPTATAAAVFVSEPDTVYATTNATAGSADSAMPSGPPMASASCSEPGARILLRQT